MQSGSFHQKVLTRFRITSNISQLVQVSPTKKHRKRQANKKAWNGGGRPLFGSSSSSNRDEADGDGADKDEEKKSLNL